jgi:hypothetical protein
VPGASVADDVELHLSRRLAFQEGLQSDFEIAHGHDAVDGSFAEFLGESEASVVTARRWRCVNVVISLTNHAAVRPRCDGWSSSNGQALQRLKGFRKGRYEQVQRKS